ncbi:helix-turn-helix domain-containing protein [Nitrosomonas sp. Is37]|uniref:winged helix-turn-helix transcriptional regulator n=1 Tax=Nitrosomonas sp. Is37 TaxID=3080535 RepID=UPI00294AC7C6|nr:helix-turn-helix domain-containing protein [Nitrosomonas sp. Is37]MDV6345206.1 helix-turn-helix domain-containing protein [Nitrosomonas sp. Is37]
MPKKEVCCPVEVTLKVIGGRWKVLIIYYLLNGTMRFNELQRHLTGITHRTLSRQLNIVLRTNKSEYFIVSDISFHLKHEPLIHR